MNENWKWEYAQNVWTCGQGTSLLTINCNEYGMFEVVHHFPPTEYGCEFEPVCTKDTLKEAMLITQTLYGRKNNMEEIRVTQARIDTFSDTEIVVWQDADSPYFGHHEWAEELGKNTNRPVIYKANTHETVEELCDKINTLRFGPDKTKWPKDGE